MEMGKEQVCRMEKDQAWAREVLGKVREKMEWVSEKKIGRASCRERVFGLV